MKKSFKIILTGLILNFALLTNFVEPLNAYASSLSSSTVPTPEYIKSAANYKNSLNIGMYWFDENNIPHKDGSLNSPFDKTKPTVIFVHGWEAGYAKENYLVNFDFNYISNDINKHLIKDWIKKGYNVGAFNWVQLSDEDEVKNAEAKIWTKDYIWKGYFSDEKIGMRWKYADNTFESINTPNKNAAELFYDAYVKAMKGFRGDHIRIVGHSLGNQMAIRLMDLIDKNIKNGNLNEELMPDRVALLDPYYSYESKYYLNGSTTAVEAYKIAKRLITERRIIFEMYKSSSLTNGTLSGDGSKDLEKICYHADMYPYYFKFYQQGLKHTIPIIDYFWSSVYSNKKDNPVFGSYLNDASIGAMMGNAFYWYQNEGHYTIDPKDDIYVPYKLNTYVPQSDISITIKNKTFTNVTLAKHPVINLKLGEYLKIKANVYPQNATSKIVSFDKVSGNKSSIQLATNGVIKGIAKGKVLLKIYSINLNDNGYKSNIISKYIAINVI